ncbi:MAG: AAA family ATPase [Candidatus Electrothrix scaldis]|nr:MAG: AAA family ATPase [Candidatus Electrothrix sp. GW3-3]
MLQQLDIKNFTVFQNADLTFANGLNVVIGENSSGKTHILKLAYSIIAASAEAEKKFRQEAPTKSILQGKLADKLHHVFRPERLGRLVQRRQGRERCTIKAQFAKTSLNTSLSFASQSKSEVKVDLLPKVWADKPPVYLPTRELLSLYPNFISVYENHYLEFEETYRDTCLLLGAPPLRGAREKRIAELLTPIEDAMGGKISLDKNGRFYLHISGRGKMEIQLVAEGLRKIGMVTSLIATGSLLDKGYLFWDEPETNLNPRLIKLVAEAIFRLCCNGIQVFIATHSLFLLRELEILSQQKTFNTVKTKYFALGRSESGITLQQGESIDDIDPVAALDESLMQSDRYLAET